MPHLATGELETYYETHGDGRPLVLIHASLLDLTSWKGQIEALGSGHRVVAYDMRGHGRTGGSARRAYTVDLLVDDLHAFLQGAKIERPVLCGHSLGGMVALAYAARYPANVSGLVVSGTPAPPLLSFSERLQRVVLPRVMVGVARLIGYERLKKGLMKAQRRVHGDEAVGTVQATDLPSMATAEFAKVVRCFARFHKNPVALSAIKAPTLVVCGEHEPAFIHQHAERIRSHVPTATVTVIAKAGHAAHLDQPAAFAEALNGFLARTHGAHPLEA